MRLFYWWVRILGRISVHRMWFRTAFCFWSRVKSTGVSHSTCRSSFLWHAITIPRTAESLQSLSLSYIYIPQYLQSLPFILTNQSRMSRVLRARRTTTWRPFFSSQSRKGFDFISTLHAHLLGSPYLHSYERSPLGGLRPSSVPLSRLH